MDWIAPWSLPLARVDEGASITELFGVALGPFVIGIALFLFGAYGQRSGTFKPGIKWLGLVPLVIGAVLGWEYFQKVSGPEGDAFVMLNMIERKKVLYQLAFFAPVVGLVLLPLLNHLILRRPSLAEDEFMDHEEAVDAGYDEEYVEEIEEIEEFDQHEEPVEEEVFDEEEVYEEDLVENEALDADAELLEEEPPESEGKKADSV
jgi:hypothetical protein